MSGSISPVVVNWNSKDDTLECLKSILDAGIHPGQIIVVDNASSDGSVQAIQAAFEGRIQVVCSDSNVGYAGGVNLGIAAAGELNPDWVFILNNDTHVSPGIFTELTRAGDRHPEYSILAPTIYYSDQPEVVWYDGERLVGGTLLTTPLVKDRNLPSGLPEIQEVDFVSGCGMLVRRQVFDRAGLFDPDLFMYGEEIDFLWRCRLAGYRFAAVRDASMWHKVSQSSSRDRVAARYYRTRNQNRFYRRYSNGWQAGVMFLFSVAKLATQGVRDIFRGQPQLLNPLFKGWYQGWFRSGESTRWTN